MSSDYSETFSKEQIKEASNRFNGMAGCTLKSGLFVSTDALAAFALAQMDRAEKAEATISDLLGSVKRIGAERDRLKKENDALRLVAAKLFAKHGGKWHYCGVENIGLCPHGFPGCAVADDIMAGEDEVLLWLKTERDEARRELAEADAILKEILEEMEEVDASGGWEGDEGLFNRGMEYLRARERGNQYARVQKKKGES